MLPPINIGQPPSPPPQPSAPPPMMTGAPLPQGPEPDVPLPPQRPPEFSAPTPDQRQLQATTAGTPQDQQPQSGPFGMDLSKLGEGLSGGLDRMTSDPLFNLGIGIPTLVANYLPYGIEVELQSENGLLGMGPFPFDGDEDADLINAGKQTITMLAGSAVFDSAMSFGMIRAQKIDLTILGAMEVSEHGDIANWKVPGKMVKGMGGAMDLVASAKNIIVAMQHCDKAGNSKLLPHCTLPLTGVGCVKKVVSDLGVFDIHDGAFHLVELAPDVTLDEVRAKTAGKLVVH
jgi:3-oxoacid CoA-transferase subunit B